MCNFCDRSRKSKRDKRTKKERAEQHLFSKYKMTPEEAYNYILYNRPQAFHYGKFYNFNDALVQYYNDLYC